MPPSMGSRGGAEPAAGIPAYNPPTLRSMKDGGSMIASPTVKYRQQRGDSANPDMDPGLKVSMRFD